jgi:hypothetical protein
VSFHPGFSRGTRLPGHDLKTIRNTIFDCLHRPENGEAFRAALDAAGLMRWIWCLGQALGVSGRVWRGR